MKAKIKILILEDVLFDLELILLELKKAKIKFNHLHVETEKDFRNALIDFCPDLILSDYSLPQFTGIEALKIVRDISPTLPFIIVTGSMNEEVAVKCMKAGASDYILKEHIGRLESAIIGAIEKQKSAEAKIEAENYLRESEDRLNAAQKLAQLGYVDINLVTGEIEWSDETYNICGFNRTEFKPTLDNTINIVHPNDAEFVQKEFERALKGEKEYDVVHRNIRPDGSIIWVHALGKITCDNKGIPIRMMGTTLDITERKNSEEDLKQQHSLNEIINKIQSQFIISSDKSKTFDLMLQDLLKLTGSQFGFIGDVLYTESKVPYLKTYALTNISWDKATSEFYNKNAPEGLEFHNLNTLFGAALKSKESIISNNTAQDPLSGGIPQGHPKLESFMGLPLKIGNKLIGMIGMANRKGGYNQKLIDYLHPALLMISNIMQAYQINNERIKAEKALQDSEESLSSAQKITHIGNWDWDIINNTGTWSQETYNIFGVDRKNFTPNYENYMNAIHPDDRESVAKAVGAGMEKDVPVDIDYRIKRPDGSERVINSKGKTIRDKKGKPIRLLGTCHDITERKEADEEISRLANMLDVAPNSITIHDFNGNFLYANQKTYDLHGYSEAEFQALPLGKLDTPDTARQIPARMKKLSELGTANFQVEHYKKDGSIIPLEVYARIIKWGDANAVLSIATDITERKLAEESLKMSELKYKTLFDEDLTGNFIASVDGKFLICNLAMAKIFGFDSVEEIQKINISSLYLPDNSREEFLNLIRKEKRVVEHETEYILPDGRVISVIQNVIGEFDENDKLIRLKGYMFDNTKRKHAEQIQKILYNISSSVITSNNLEELISVIQLELETIIDVSNFYIALYDEKTDSIALPFFADEKDKFTSFPAGKTLTYYVIKTQKSLLATKDVIEVLEQSGEIDSFGSNSEIWLGVPLKVNGKVTGVLAVQSYTDENAYSVSDMEILEFVSEQVSISVERKKTEQDLIKALEKAQESDRLKTAFLTNMSHEVRTPMNGIMGFTDLLKSPDLTSLQLNKYIDIIARSGDRMLNTIGNLMDFSIIESGQMQISISEIEINRKTLDLYSFFKPEVEKKGMILELNNSLFANESIIKTDIDKLNSILTNLIKNAIKYSHKGIIEFGYIKKGRFLEFYVKDNGIGINEKRQQAIFDRFVQADIEDRDVYEGNGLGLSISKAYVEMLGGKIWVESQEGLGSTFYFTIPYKPVIIEIPDKTETTVHSSQGGKLGVISKRIIDPEDSGLKILIVEDEEFADLHLSIILKNIAKEILHAKTGTEAVEICQNNPDLDLILMDVKMPIMDGYEATKEIRKFNKDVLIIAQTAYALLGDREKALKAGCDDYISKPIVEIDLLNRIDST